MSTFKTEAEQVDDLKRWTKTYGPSVLAGILIAVAVIYGRQFWHNHQTQKAQEASVLYQSALDAFDQQQLDTFEQQANTLIKQAPNSPYAEYITLLQAKIAVDKHNLPLALQKLEWAVAHAPDKHLKALATIRLAKVQIANQQADKALTTLDGVKDPAYIGLADIVRGDAYFTLDKREESKQAYLRAQKTIPNVDQLMPTLQMRIDNSGE